MPLRPRETPSVREQDKLKVRLRLIDEATTLHEVSPQNTKKRKMSELTQQPSTGFPSALLSKKAAIVWLKSEFSQQPSTGFPSAVPTKKADIVWLKSELSQQPSTGFPSAVPTKKADIVWLTPELSRQY
jgi:hypothetical protein